MTLSLLFRAGTDEESDIVTQFRGIDTNSEWNYERQREFNLEGHAISTHYLLCLPDVATTDTAKVVVTCVSSRTARDLIQQASNVVLVEVALNFEAYWQLEKRARKQMRLDALHTGLLRVARAKGWPVDPFEQAYQQVLAEKIDLHRYWKAPKWNDRRTMKGQILYHFDIDRIEIFAVAWSKDGAEVGKKLLASTDAPFYDFLYDSRGKYGWVDEKTFRLTSRGGESVWDEVFANDS
jgi:hypothetical protein